ncbi:MAG: hypothetical protein V1839_02360, partial [archaeon]
SFFSAFKRKFGSSLSCRSARTQRAEVYCRAIIHNITAAIKEIFNAAAYFNLRKTFGFSENSHWTFRKLFTSESTIPLIAECAVLLRHNFQHFL